MMRVLIILSLLLLSCSSPQSLQNNKSKEARLSCLDNVLENFDEMRFVFENIGADTIKITEFLGSKNIPITLKQPNGKVKVINSINYPHPVYEWKISPGQVDTFSIPIHSYFDHSIFSKDSIYSIGLDFEDLKINKISCAYKY